jgi:hypothetical protein
MPIFSGITGLDENYEKSASPNADEDYGLTKIIAKKYGSNFVCQNIKKDIWYKIKDKINNDYDEDEEEGEDEGYNNRNNIIEWSLCESKIYVRTLITTNFYEYIKDVLGVLKTNYIDKYDNEILNKYRIKTIVGNIVKIMNGLHKTKKINKIMTELRILMFKEDFLKERRIITNHNRVREFIDDCIIQREGGCILKNVLITVFKEWFNTNYGYIQGQHPGQQMLDEMSKNYKMSNGVYIGVSIKPDNCNGF